MKVSKSWLKELVDKVVIEEVERLLPLRTIGTKEITDDFIELDMKGYNRADLLSIRGVAREVAAITNSEITFNELNGLEYTWASRQLPSTPVTTDEELNPLQAVAKIEGLKVNTSPKEWVKKLTDSGMRSVNNIVDVTNLIMLEYGHPLHAFDANKVKNDTINIRRAKDGEEIVTLDGKLRKLTAEDIILADDEKPLDVAGVMGGEGTQTSNSTRTILLSASLFNPAMVRKTSQRLKLSSEASKRFYHGLTRKRLLQALDRAIKMYEELGGKLTALTLIGNLEDRPKTVILTLKKINSLIGIDIPEENIKKYLESLGFHLRGVNVNSWEVEIPYWRLDIDIEEDLIEEVARMFGYEKIPAKKLQGKLPERIDQSLFEKIYKTKKFLAEAGLTEVQTYSFYSTGVLAALGFNESLEDAIVKIANPISKETEYLREFIWPNLIEVVEKNLRRDFNDIAIFEIGKIYLPGKDNPPKESYHLAIALMNDTDNPLEELLVILNSIQDLLHIQIEKGGMMKELETIFHPKRFATVKSGDKVIGGIAEVHPRFLNNFGSPRSAGGAGITKRVAILEIKIE